MKKVIFYYATMIAMVVSVSAYANSAFKWAVGEASGSIGHSVRDRHKACEVYSSELSEDNRSRHQADGRSCQGYHY